MRNTQEIKIGKITLPSRLFLAPMAGITDTVLRSEARRYGAGLSFTEMICVEGIVRRHPKSILMMKTSPEERPIAIQLYGNDPDTIARAADIAQANADIIDLNFGCPAKTVVRRGCGSALLKQPELIKDIVTKVVRTVSCPVTAKIRSGWDKSSVNALKIAQIIEDSGADAVTIHPRLRSQGFSGRSDWQVIADVKDAVSIPVIGNGDVKSPEDAKRMFELTACDAVMIGRGALGNPWIFSRTIQYLKTGIMPPEPSPEERLQHLLKFARTLVELKGEKIACKEIRKFVKWYTKGMPYATDLRYKAVRIESLKELEELIMEFQTGLQQEAITLRQGIEKED